MDAVGGEREKASRRFDSLTGLFMSLKSTGMKRRESVVKKQDQTIVVRLGYEKD